MSQQAEALLGIVGAYYDMSPTERVKTGRKLKATPVVCTPMVWDLAHAAAEEIDKPTMWEMRKAGLIVVHENPKARQLAELRKARRSKRAARKRSRK